MATTRAVLRDADTMVRRLGQRRRTALAGTASMLERAQRQLRQLRPARPARRRADAGASDGWRHARPGQGPESSSNRIPTTIRKGKISKPNEFGNLVTIQESEHQIITAYEVHAGRPADVTMWTPAWTDIRPSSRARRISPPAIGASARRPTNKPPPTAACDASSCRAVDRSRRRDARTNVKPGSGAVNAGASGAKGGSASLNGVMDCGAVATMAPTAWHRWVGLGVIAWTTDRYGPLSTRGLDRARGDDAPRVRLVSRRRARPACTA